MEFTPLDLENRRQPASLEILQQLHAEKDARFAQFKAENSGPDFENPGTEEDRQARLN